MAIIDSTNNNNIASTVSSSTDEAWANLSPEERQRLDKLKAQTGITDDVGLLGLTAKQIARSAHAIKNNKYSASAAVKHLPPPAAPKVQVTQQAATAYHSMAKDVNTALSQVQQNSQPIKNPFNTRDIPEGTTPEQATKTVMPAVNGYLQSALSGMNSNDMMTAFLSLQVTSQNDGLSMRQNLSTLSSNMRQQELKNERIEDDQASKKVQAALEKAKKMGVLTKVLEVFTVILTAVMAVATLGFGTGLALVAAAMLIGALAGGLKDGAKKHDGFDIDGALNGAAIAGDVALMAVGAGAALMALREMVTEIATTSMQAVKKSATEATKAAVDAAVKHVAKMSGTEGEEAAVEALKLLRKQLESETKNPLLKKFGVAFEKAFNKINAEKSLKMLGGKKIAMTGKPLKYATMGSIAVQSAGQIAQGTVQFQTNKLNLEAEEHEQYAAVAQKLADTWQGEYEDLQDYIQTVSQSHNTAVNQAMSMLSQHFQTQMRSAAAMVSGS